jgi:CheY-like chemotaxis protein
MPYDVVLLDIVMRRLDGETALRQLRAAGSSVTVIAATGNAASRDADRYLAAGFNCVLAKPFSLQDLHRALLATLPQLSAAQPADSQLPGVGHSHVAAGGAQVISPPATDSSPPVGRGAAQ